MQTGLRIDTFAEELKRQAENASDYVLPGTNITLKNSGDYFMLTGDLGDGEITTGMRELAHQQLARRLEIPQKYYDRMRRWAPDLLIENAHRWLEEGGDRYMVRTLDGYARAVLSDAYLRLDNHLVADRVLGPMMDAGMEFKACEVTETRMYIQAVTPDTTREIKKGDAVQFGLTITNSEVGMGSFNIRPFIYRLVCENGMVARQSAGDFHYSRRHVGRRHSGIGAVEMQTDTLAAQAEAISLEMRDTVNHLTNPETIERMMAPLQRAAESQEIEHPEEAVQELARTVDLRESERAGVLENLIRNRDYTAWGAANAVTAAAHDVESFDRNVELQEAGSRVIELGRSQWQRIAEAEPA